MLIQVKDDKDKCCQLRLNTSTLLQHLDTACWTPHSGQLLRVSPLIPSYSAFSRLQDSCTTVLSWSSRQLCPFSAISQLPSTLKGWHQLSNQPEALGLSMSWLWQWSFEELSQKFFSSVMEQAQATFWETDGVIEPMNGAKSSFKRWTKEMETIGTAGWMHWNVYYTW